MALNDAAKRVIRAALQANPLTWFTAPQMYNKVRRTQDRGATPDNVREYMQEVALTVDSDSRPMRFRQLNSYYTEISPLAVTAAEWRQD